MALSAGALTTFDRMEAELGTKAPRPLKTPLEGVINAVSAAMIRVAGREFHHVELESRDLPGFSSPFLLLPRAPITSVTSIDLLGAFSGTVVSPVDPSQVLIKGNVGALWRSSGWITTAIGVRFVDAYAMSGAEGPLWRIVYNAGWRTPQQATTVFTDDSTIVVLPEDLEEAAVKSITSIWNRRGHDLSVASKSEADQSVNFRLQNIIVGLPAGLLLPETREVAKSYSRPVVQ